MATIDLSKLTEYMVLRRTPFGGSVHQIISLTDEQASGLLAAVPPYIQRITKGQPAIGPVDDMAAPKAPAVDKPAAAPVVKPGDKPADA